MSMTSKGDLNKQHILKTADGLFYRQGFDHTSFTDIADAAGIARGNFYYYFKTKDDILSAVIHKRSNDIKQMLQEWDQAIPQPRDRLKRYVQILLNSKDEIEQYGCPMGSLCTELAKLRHVQQRNVNDMFDIFRGWLIKQFKSLGHSKDARQMALHLLARCQGIALVTNAYQDKTFLKREARDLDSWIDTL